MPSCSKKKFQMYKIDDKLDFFSKAFIVVGLVIGGMATLAMILGLLYFILKFLAGIANVLGIPL